MAIPLPSTLVIIASLFLLSPKISSETNTITQLQPLTYGTNLVSEGGTFELGFFILGTSKNLYLGIWFKNIPQKTIVWVANRNNPINNTSSNSTELTISKEGNLVLLSSNNTVHWSTNATTKSKSVNVVARLLETGNLVVRDENDNNFENYLWQSFDYPSDTLLPGMKLGWEVATGLNRYITSWNNWEDPSSGHFSYGVSRRNVPDMQIWNGSSVIYRSGPWSGFRFSATPLFKRRPLVNINFVDNPRESYYQVFPRNSSMILRTVINQTANALLRFIWEEESQNWKLDLVIPRDGFCGYDYCGSFGYCALTGNTSTCECLRGFKPRSVENWCAKIWNEGCVNSSESWRCRVKNKDGFVKVSNMNIPDTKTSWMNRSMTIDECKAKCWANCSCTAYANSDITETGSGYSGCIIWFGDLLDLRLLPDAGQDLYVRLDISTIENKDYSKKVVIGVTSSVSSIVAVLVIFTFLYRRRKGKDKKVKINGSEDDLELPLFDFDTIACATNDFSEDHMLGQGGFGPVYKGTLSDGKNVAVKRLSDTSAQGLKEFKNEVIFCSKLQHRNLVKVLGYCIEEQEKLLIYEYMPNKSLNFFLFDHSQSILLDWSTRLNIITGIARGLLYLHQDSRLRIIHRDLKSSNILLDDDMNPKISDFGLARGGRGDQIEGNTRRVVGTYGYMAPEYAIGGVFSVKSDVYSFGVLLLEILSGKKNKGFSYSIHNYNLIEHAWRCWKESIPIEFIDTCLRDSYILSEALRCIHIGLLCIQHQPNDRPNMTTVVTMLTSESTLPQPEKLVFLMQRVLVEEDVVQNMYCPTNEVTISDVEPR
ncbi:G-type lectin S-receptor-like serine/threonine-protein kinase At4g27290 isoform X1 [Vigna umbellata]|uniref:G-type lectin S-receptor-like serine/threonine-protein kinase At4g27290 isoform X1 n=1 Tax=Vigna umbellata TaxID=87088 RepID=UPI001F5E7537|nr:G-type lectin S-receptor-like serine/threonine-protein kinase At4g27290 isoform X1 [Vigna umbellata]